MAQTNLLIQYWGDALLTATFIFNRVPFKSVSSTPYELWSGRKPNLKDLHPWGSTVYVHDTSHKFSKLGPQGNKCVFIRYSENSKGYVFLSYNSPGTSSSRTAIKEYRIMIIPIVSSER